MQTGQPYLLDDERLNGSSTSMGLTYHSVVLSFLPSFSLSSLASLSLSVLRIVENGTTADVSD